MKINNEASDCIQKINKKTPAFLLEFSALKWRLNCCERLFQIRNQVINMFNPD